MFKSFLSYVLGFFAGFMFFVSYVSGQPYWFITSIAITVVSLALAFYFSHRVHKRMKKRYYDMFKNDKIKREW